MDLAGFRRAAHDAVDRVCDYYATLASRPVSAQVERGYLLAALPDAAPETGEPWDAIMRDYDAHVLPGLTHWQHPMFFGFFPANSSFEGIIAEMLTSATSNPGFNWAASPAVTELEFVVVDWLARMLGLGPAFCTRDAATPGGGVILGGASEATLTMAVAARARALAHLGSSGASVDTSRLVLYCTTQTHSSAAKAAMLLGLACRTLDVRREDNYALRGTTLRAAIAEDTARGMHPFFVATSYGTTNSCAVDDLAEVAASAEMHPHLWLHVDAAYGGVTLALPEERDARLLAAINARFDSFSTNLHKWGLVPIECSPTYVRDRQALRAALELTPEYLRSRGGEMNELMDLRNLQIPLGRRARGLKMWMVLRSYGVQGFQAHLRSGYVCSVSTDASIALARRFADAISARTLPHASFELVNPPRWGLVMFRLVCSAHADTDALNRRFHERVLAHADAILLTPTVLPGVGYCERLVVGAPSTRAEHIDRAVDVLCTCALETIG